MRLVASFPTPLTPEAVRYIRKAFDDLSESEWKALVVAEGGIVYDLDQPLTIVVGDGRATVTQEDAK